MATVRINQSTMPQKNLEDALAISEALRDHFGANEATPLNLAKAVDRSPSSSDWRYLTGAAVAYGLTEGSYNSEKIVLTQLGRRIVKPTKEGLKENSLVEAVLKPEIPKKFYERYDKNKFPRDDIAKNVLSELGLPQDRCDDALNIIKSNGKFVGVLTTIQGSQYVQIHGSDEKLLLDENVPESALERESSVEEKTEGRKDIPREGREGSKIFVSHSKNKNILDQIKTMLELFVALYLLSRRVHPPRIRTYIDR